MPGIHLARDPRGTITLLDIFQQKLYLIFLIRLQEMVIEQPVFVQCPISLECNMASRRDLRGVNPGGRKRAETRVYRPRKY